MKILQVVDYFKPFWERGGTVRIPYEIALKLTERGHVITVYANGERADSPAKVTQNRPVFVDGMTVYYFKTLSKRFTAKTNIDLPYFAPFIVRRHLREFDIVHIHTYRRMLAVPVWHYARRFRIPYVVQAHGSLSTYFLKGRQKRLFDKLWGLKILRDAARVIALTADEAEQYRAMGVPENRIEIIPGGIDLKAFENLPPRGTFRTAYGIGENERVVLYLGRIHRIKGLDLLVTAFADLCREMKETRLVIVGGDDGYLQTLQQMVKDFDIGEQVLFTGFLDGDIKLAAYADADVYVLPSVYECFPTTVMEACACGTPVIVTNVCQMAPQIENRVGLAVPPDRQSLRRALSTILTNHEMRARMARSARTVSEDLYSMSRYVERIESVYQQVLTAREPTP